MSKKLHARRQQELKQTIDEIWTERETERTRRLRRRALFWFVLLVGLCTISAIFRHEYLIEGVKILVVSFIDLLVEASI